MKHVFFIFILFLSTHSHAQKSEAELNSFIQNQLFNGYPIFGSEKHTQDWATDGLGKKWVLSESTQYSTRFWTKTLTSLNKYMRSGHLEIKTRESNRLLVVDNYNVIYHFYSLEEAYIYTENIKLALRDVYKINSNDDGYELKTGLLLVKSGGSSIEVIFFPNDANALKFVNPFSFLKNQNLTPFSFDKVETPKSLIWQKQYIISPNIVDESKKNPNCVNRCLRFDGIDDKFDFKWNQVAGRSIEVHLAQPKLKEIEPPAQESLHNFEHIITIDYKDVTNDFSRVLSTGIIELGLIQESVYLLWKKNGKSSLIPTKSNLARGLWHHIYIDLKNDIFGFTVDGKVVYDFDDDFQKILINNVELFPYKDEGSFFNGYVDEIRVWERQLSFLELEEYPFHRIEDNPALLFNYHFDDGIPYGENSNRIKMKNSGKEASNLEFSSKNSFMKKGDVSNYVCSDAPFPTKNSWIPETQEKVGEPSDVVYDFANALKENKNWQQYLRQSSDGKTVDVRNIKFWSEIMNFEHFYGFKKDLFYRLSPDGNSAEVYVQFKLISKKLPETGELDTKGLFLLQKINGVWKIIACPA